LFGVFDLGWQMSKPLATVKTVFFTHRIGQHLRNADAPVMALA
jgi:hypothetical protein